MERGRQPGSGQRGAADQHRQGRISLVRHGRRAAAGTLGQLADLRSGQRGDVGGDMPVRIRAGDERVGDPGERGPDRVPGRPGRQGPSAAAVVSTSCQETATGSHESAQPGQLGRCRQGAGRAAELHGQAVARAVITASAASTMPVSQPATFSPKVIGTACWVRVRPTSAVSTWLGGEHDQLFDLASMLGAKPVEHLAQAQHQPGVDDVLAGQAAMQPAGRLRPAAARAAARPDRSPGCRRPPHRPRSSRGPQDRRARGRRAERRPARSRRSPAHPATPTRPTPSPTASGRRSAGLRRARRRARTDRSPPQCPG